MHRERIRYDNDVGCVNYYRIFTRYSHASGTEDEKYMTRVLDRSYREETVREFRWLVIYVLQPFKECLCILK